MSVNATDMTYSKPLLTSMFDDPQISLVQDLKHYDLKLRLN